MTTMHALDTMRALAEKAEVREVEPGMVIFRSGEPGDCMFGVLEGLVDLSWNDHAYHEQIKAGDVFGAGALVTPEH
jgi:CRP-like cAMP-binding protein